MKRQSYRWPLALGSAALVAGLAVAQVTAQSTATGVSAPRTGETRSAHVSAGVPAQGVPVNGVIEADNACYYRLPDLPEARYGGFGGFNHDTGVLFYVGGARKASDENTIAFHDLYGLDLKDGPTAKWKTIPYGQSVGYNRAQDRGCREMTSVRLPMVGGKAAWLSVWGKDGCLGRGSKDGDLKEMRVGDSANAQGIKWVPNSGAQNLPPELEDGRGKLVRNFATYDAQRDRVVFGQGTFDDTKDQETQDEVYAAAQSGSKWQVRELRPSGRIPSRRFSSCATYVYDADTGVDGMLVLGGQQGGDVETTSYKEVWWLDFSGNPQGEWVEITDQFTNMDDIGYRRGGACAYNPETKNFYSWMGRADKSLPHGAKRSAGLWRANLDNLGEAVKGNADLSWERLAKDDQPGIEGRRLIPSVYDFSKGEERLFAMGGRNSLDAWKDTWVIYPDLTGSECQSLNPYPAVPTPEPSNTPLPTSTPDPNGTAQPPTAEPITPDYQECDFVNGRVPPAVLAAAMANPDTVFGAGELCNPNIPGPSVVNGWRDKLSLRNPAAPYHPTYNGVVWNCGCP